MKQADRQFKLLVKPEGRLNSSPMRNFLMSVNLEGLYEVLKDNQVTFYDLPLITKDDLIDLEVPVGPRNRLLKAVQSVDFDKIESRASEYEESMEGTGRFGTNEEVR
jgi:hypothetical protein